jgi:cytochrome c-type biogenesis protein CcmH
MTAFILAALLLFVITGVFLLLPLLRPQADTAGEDSSASARFILRKQLAELEAKAQAGQLSAASLSEAREELQRRVLEETAPADHALQAPDKRSSNPLPDRRTAIVIMLFLAFSSVLGYAFLGNPAALDPLQRQAKNEVMSQEAIEAAIAQMAADMLGRPDDDPGWIRLGNAYKALERPAEAVAAYAHAENLIATDPALLTDYAEALAAAGAGLKGKPVQLIHKALQLNPEHARALFLAGAAAYEANDKAAAADYWEKLLPKVEPGSEVHTLLKEKIAAFRAERKK